MIAIWYMDMPRARTQSGRPIWIETLSVLAEVIQAAPPRNIAGTATQTWSVNAMVAMAPACRAVPRKTRPSRG
ncbi:hypothetical protein D9M68_911570 [compost metagenome]